MRLIASRFYTLVLFLLPAFLCVSLVSMAAPALAQRAVGVEAKPSFDCRKAQSETERAICASPNLSRIDAELGKLYWARMAELKGTGAEEEKRRQRDWGVARNTCGANVACVEESYRRRIPELGGTVLPWPVRQAAPGAGTPAARATRNENMDAPGNDLSWIKGVASIEACESLCAANSACAGYTYNKARLTCIPKTAIGPLVPSREPAVTGILARQGGGASAVAQRTMPLREPVGTPSPQSYAQQAQPSTTRVMVDGLAVDILPVVPSKYEIEAARSAAERPLLEKQWSKASWGTQSERFPRLQIWPGHDAAVKEVLFKTDEEDAAVVRQVQAQVADLKANLTGLRKKLGDRHPLVGYVVADLADKLSSLQYTQKTAGLAPDPGIPDEVAALRNGAIDPLLATGTIDRRVATILNQQALQVALKAQDPDHKGCPASDTTPRHAKLAARKRAAEIDLRLFGPRLEQVGLLRTAALCAGSSDKRLAIVDGALTLARSLASEEGIITSLAEMRIKLDLAVTLYRAKKVDDARKASREAFAIFKSELYKAKPDIDIEDNTEDSASIPAMLAGLGLGEEAEIWLRHHIERLLDDESNVGRSNRGSWLIIAEDIDRSDLADEYYQRLAGKTGSPAEVMASIHASAENPRYLERALQKARVEGNEKVVLDILIWLAVKQDEAGNFERAVEVAREALRLSSTVRVKRSKFEQDIFRESVAGLKQILARAAREAKQGNQAVTAVLASLDDQLTAHCRRRPKAVAVSPARNALVIDEAAGMPKIPVDVIDGEPGLVEAVVESPLVDEYSRCFAAKRNGIYFGSPGPSNGMEAASFSDVMYIHAKRNDRKRADQEITNLLSDFSRMRPGDKFYSANIGAFLTAMHAAFEGLDRGGRREWFTARLHELERLDILSRIGRPPWNSNEMSEGLARYGLLMRVLGDRKRAQSTHALLLRDQTNPCELYGATCELAAVIAEDAGDSIAARKYYEQLVTRLILDIGGASLDGRESMEFDEQVISRGMRYARLGLYNLAAAYLETYDSDGSRRLKESGQLTPTSIALDTLLVKVHAGRGNKAEAHRITNKIIGATRARFAAASTFGPDAAVRWSSRLRGPFEEHLALVTDPALRSEAAPDDDYFAMQYLQLTRTAVTFAKQSARMRGTGEAVKKHQALANRLTTAYDRLLLAKGSEAADVLAEITRLESESAELTGRIEVEQPDYFRFGRLQALGIDETKSLLRPGEALLSTYVGIEAVYAWLVTSTTAELKRLSITPQDLSTKIAAWRKATDPEASDADLPIHLAHDLYRIVLEPFGAALEPMKHLTIVPNGAFDGLSFASLLTGPPAAATMSPTALRGAKLSWLVRKAAIDIIPSVASLKLGREAKSSSRARKPFFGVGNPVFSSTADGRATLLGRSLTIVALPETEVELRTIGTALGFVDESDLLLGSLAREPELRGRKLSDYRVVAFATHGLLAGDFEGVDEPALVLTLPEKPTPDDDGLLTASEVTALDLDADVVILSACNTAGSDGTPGAEGLSGLANAFFFAGARHLLVTHWAIPSAAAVEITTNMVAAHADGASRSWAEALQRATLRLVDELGPAETAHPANWGAYIMVGAGS
jgi:CHAT domain-containing protein/uncharacterized protein